MTSARVLGIAGGIASFFVYLAGATKTPECLEIAGLLMVFANGYAAMKG